MEDTIMRKIQQYALTLLFAAMAVASASAQHSQANMVSSNYDYILEVKKAAINIVDNKVVVALQLLAIQDVPARQSVILVPELQDTISERYVQFAPIYINSRNQQIFYERELHKYIDDAVALRKYNDKDLKIDYLRSVPYQRWMETSVLKLRKLSCGCNVSTERGEETLCRLRNSEPELRLTPAFRVPVAEAVKVREERGTAYLRFVVDKWDIRPDYMTNKAELDKINQTIDLVRNDPNVQIRKMTIDGYASPEGNVEHNMMLSVNRTNALREYLLNYGTLHNVNIEAKGMGENWKDFREVLYTDRNIPQVDKLRDILNSNADDDEKERMMRKEANEGFIYCVNNHFPKLRCTNYAVEYTVRPFTVEESEQIFETRPINLSLNEIYMLADKYKGNPERYNEIMSKASLIYPKDPYVNLTMASLAIKRKDANEAERLLKNVPDWPEKQLNQFMIDYLRGKISRKDMQRIQEEYYGTSR